LNIFSSLENTWRFLKIVPVRGATAAASKHCVGTN